MVMQKANIKYLLVAILLILPLLLGSCVYIDTQPPGRQPTPVPPPEITTTPNPDWKLPPPASQPSLPDFVTVVTKVKPSVVAINTEVLTLDIFNRPTTEKGAGSGWVLDKEGYIVTNNHVIEGAKSITVTLANGAALPATVVGTDSLSDIAILKVSGTSLPPAQIGDSSRLSIGEWVLAIGNALGEGISATQGIISRLGVPVRVQSGQTLYDLIQTSAAINPGNSGGPLVNMAGEVVGITSAKLAAVGIEGMGYAISSNTARPIIEELSRQGYVLRPWLGVVLRSMNQWLVVTYRLAVEKGAFVTEVARGSPADKAGLQARDVIVGLNNKEITSAEDLIRAVHAGKIDEEVKITYWRGNAKSTTTAVLVQSPKASP